MRLFSWKRSAPMMRLEALESRLMFAGDAPLMEGGLDQGGEPAVAEVQVAAVAGPARQVEALDRGVVAIRQSASGVYVGWRLLGLDDPAVTFNLYRVTQGGPAVRVNAVPLWQTTDYFDGQAPATQSHTYFVRAVNDGVEGPDSGRFTLVAGSPVQPYLSVPIQPPPGGTIGGQDYTYTANDASVGDLDGDGEYEIILKWDPTNSGDNNAGLRGNVYIDAYRLDGTQLWRVDLGRNIRAGSHYTQFIVYDLDGDGRSEVAMKTAPGTIDGQGNAVLMDGDSADADYRNASGYILDGPEYMTVFDGLTGGELDTIAFEAARGDVSEWGDDYGNRVDRFTAGVAYLDGQRPSMVMGRGYYGPRPGFDARNEVVAYDFRDGELSIRWHFKARTDGPNAEYIGQGAHSLTIGDVDGDGFDEVVYGASTIDHDGTGLYSTGLGHGDALHLSDMDPTRPGQEIFMVHESPSAYQSNGRDAGGGLRDAATGQLLFQIPSDNDVGRGVAGDIDPNHLGYEFWGTTNQGVRMIYNVDGTALYETPSNMMYNFVIHWDADLSHELLDGMTISEWNNPGRQNFDLDPNSSNYWPAGVVSNNGTKSTAAIAADILGDWRDEVVWRTSDNTELRIFTTTIPANSRFYTLMHDTQYRVSIAAQNSAYNQPAHPSFYFGQGMAEPPTPNIVYTPYIGVPAAEPDVYPAESAEFGGSYTGFENTNVGFRDTGYVNFSPSDGFLQFNEVDGGGGGTTTLRFRYALGNSDRTGRLIVNGVAQDITFLSTTTWINYRFHEVRVALEPGVINTIRLESISQDLANIDELQLTPNPVVLPGDVDRDGQVSDTDLSLLLAHWGQAIEINEPYWLDQDDDSVVGFSDLTIVLTNMGNQPPASTEGGVAPSLLEVSLGLEPLDDDHAVPALTPEPAASSDGQGEDLAPVLLEYAWANRNKPQPKRPATNAGLVRSLFTRTLHSVFPGLRDRFAIGSDDGGWPQIKSDRPGGGVSPADTDVILRDSREFDRPGRG